MAERCRTFLLRVSEADQDRLRAFAARLPVEGSTLDAVHQVFAAGLAAVEQQHNDARPSKDLARLRADAASAMYVKEYGQG